MEYLENTTIELDMTKETLLNDYRIACESREASLLGRKEVFMGKAKFGIFGDGKEVAQIAMAKAFQPGDFRSGYYRDQTFMMAIGELTLEAFFAQLYAHTDVEHDPASAGRCMNSHFATRSQKEDGSWKDIANQYNSAADISPTAGQMPRLAGLAYASKLYRENPELAELTQFSNKGNEIAFGTIGNASCAEGAFFETVNAIGVLKVPAIISVWDDGYGISVPNDYQVAKGSISEGLSGLQRKSKDESGYEMFKVKGWDYVGLCEAFQKAETFCREEHVPALIHVIEVTQPQGHSTSGSHERYKTAERLQWEQDYDCLVKFKEWILTQNMASSEELEEIEKAAVQRAKEARKSAWNAFVDSMKEDYTEAVRLIAKAEKQSQQKVRLQQIRKELEKTINPIRSDAVRSVKKALRELRFEDKNISVPLRNWLARAIEENEDRYSSLLYSESEGSALKVEKIAPKFADNPPVIDGREVMNACFDNMLARDPRVFAIGEDVGQIGDVNQGFAGLQEKYGELRVTDTGIREATIVGQGVGTALRGLRPIIEIQYLDYIFYALFTLTDDLACLQYRTKGGQKAPVIIRTRGHRLEGIWHSGSPMGGLVHSLRGIYILTPRNMTKAAGFYNTMLKSDDTAIIIECLNGYRLKEKLPENIGEYTEPLGQPETIREGKDITVVTYGSMCRIVMDAATQLAEVGIEIEVVDVQTLLPFDVDHKIVESIQKTNRVIFADEDVSGGATGFMMQKVLDEQNAYRWLDSKPVAISAKDHRPAYASDGDYFSKPNVETVFDAAYEMMSEVDPQSYPELY